MALQDQQGLEGINCNKILYDISWRPCTSIHVIKKEGENYCTYPTGGGSAFRACIRSPCNFTISSILLVLGQEVFSDHLRVVVDRRVETHSLRTSDHLGDLALVDWTKLRFCGVLDHARASGELAENGKVLQERMIC